ncbi:MAG TPA: cytochrome c biogenesis protein CcdA [Aeromicrobium sp.]|nr:cytochrome c biogenesis protein CcdA [Aeromicrobium sp.]HKY56837.1 cytochrome c biogenesis protein CcdA [Aeromicrobium sp.]
MNASLTVGITDTVASGSLVVALPIAVAAGLLSFASPCVVPLLPGYLSYMTGVAVQDLGTARRGRMLAGSSLFVLGFTVLFVSGGAFFGGIGGQLVEYQSVISKVLGVFVIAFGLAFIGWVPMLQREVRLAVPGVGLAMAPVLGLLFGLGWVPCLSPTLGTVTTLAYTEATAGRGALLAFAYCVGLGVPFVLVAVAFGRLTRALDWVRVHQRALTLFGGGLMVALGVLLVTGLWDVLIIELRSRIGSGEIAL